MWNEIFFSSNSLFRNDHADDGELFIDFVFAGDDFAFEHLAVEFLHKEFELAAFEPKPNVAVRRAERFFFMLCEVEERSAGSLLPVM